MSSYNPVDTAAAIKATALAVSGAVFGSVAPHPLQIIGWTLAIASGILAIIFWAIRIRKELKDLRE